MFDSVLIANRGEIACRVARTLHRLGILAIAVHTAADADSPHVRLADRSVPIDSYLEIDALLAACEQTGAQALHPGYGFLSESPELARACERVGVTFVGPPPAASELMGDKLRAKRLAIDAGVPTVPVYTVDEARTAAYPLLVKAAAGGGGRGMRVVDGPEDLDAALQSAAREAKAGFGDERVFIERLLTRARHLEVQVLADAHGNVVALGERECSLQRRHQKLIEECPSPVVGPQLRAALEAEAVALARAGGYVNAGTVEFIADADDPSEHYFLEINARLQVEHPVTELVYGLDLVEQQLRVAAGEPLALAPDQLRPNGHAIEARITAEDPARGFLPAAGRILAYDRPAAELARVDDGIELGSEVGTGYDSLLAKVIAHGPDRDRALARLQRALSKFTVLGVTTTTAYLRGLLDDDAVRAGDLDTELVARRGVPAGPIGDPGIATAAAMLILAERGHSCGDDPFARVDGWRPGGARAPSHWRLAIDGRAPVEVSVPAEYVGITHPLPSGRFAIDDRGEWLLARDAETIWIGHGGAAWAVRPGSEAVRRATTGDGELRAPMPGQVLAVHGAVGDSVSGGDPVVVLESMKMELVMTAPIDGSIAELTVAAGDRVTVDQPLARIEATRR